MLRASEEILLEYNFLRGFGATIACADKAASCKPCLNPDWQRCHSLKETINSLVEIKHEVDVKIDRKIGENVDGSLYRGYQEYVAGNRPCLIAMASNLENNELISNDKRNEKKRKPKNESPVH